MGTLVQKLRDDGSEQSEVAAFILLLAYAAKKIQHNGDGTIRKDEVNEIVQANLHYLTEHKIEELRNNLIDNVNECYKLIYGKSLQ